MIEECLPGAWRVGGGSWGLKAHRVLSVKRDCNVYLLRMVEGYALADCGSLEGKAHIEGNLADLGIAPDDVTDLLLTHSHADHTEGAAQWRSSHNVRIHLNTVGAEHLARGESCLLGYVHGESDFTHAPFHVDHAVEDGERFDVAGTEVTSLAVPGHTPDSTLYVLELCGTRLGVSGDLCFAPADWDPVPGGIGALRTLWKSNLRAYAKSLKRVLDLDLDALLPGHGFIVSGPDDVREIVSASLATIERFLATPKIHAFGMGRGIPLPDRAPPPDPKGKP